MFLRSLGTTLNICSFDRSIKKVPALRFVFTFFGAISATRIYTRKPHIHVTVNVQASVGVASWGIDECRQQQTAGSFFFFFFSHINSCQTSRVRGHTKVLEP